MNYKLKIGFFALFFSISLYGKSYVLDNQNQILDKTADFIEVLANEVYEKTGVGLYIVALEDLEGMNLQEKELLYKKDLKNPYILLFFVKKKKKLILSPQRIVLKCLIKKKSIGIILCH